MSELDARIERLRTKLCRLYHHSMLREARKVAERLEALLGEPTPESLRWYVHSWVLISDVRGNLREAIRFENLDIARKRAEIEAGDYDPYPELLAEQVEYLQTGLFFQAERYAKLHRRAKAIECLQEASELGARYDVPPDEDIRNLLVTLTASIG